MLFFPSGDLCCQLQVGNLILRILYFWQHNVKRQFTSLLKKITFTYWVSVHFLLVCRNKKNNKNLSRLVVRPHTDAVYHACFSEDGQRIASCGVDKTLQVKQIS